MMELTDVMALVKAGFTRDEIKAMEQGPAPDTDPVPIVEPAAQPVPAEVAVPVAVAEPTPAAQPQPQPVQNEQKPVQNEPTLSDLMQTIAKLTSAVQANAIAQSVIPQGLQNASTAEDMLAEIIRPTYHGRTEQ